MADTKRRSTIRMLFLIATPKLGRKAADFMKKEHIPVHQFHGQGTASSEIMDLLGLGSIEKSILMCFMPREAAGIMLKALRKTLHLGMPNTGVAFTVSVLGGTASLIKFIESKEAPESAVLSNKEGNYMTGSNYSLILAVVNQGFSEEVMDAAKPAGASGGTVFHSRWSGGGDDTRKFLGISIQQEREIVLILARKEDRLPIMKAIDEKCGGTSKARGFVMSLPVDGAEGLDG